MDSYKTYTKRLESVISRYSEQTLEDTHHHLNGGASEALTDLIDAKEIKDAGAFFTPLNLAEKVISLLKREEIKRGVFDPSCGAGDLLLRFSERLKIQKTLSGTILEWGKLIAGCDIHQEFVDATKRRLVLSALSRGCKNDLQTIDYDLIFPRIRKSDFFQVLEIGDLTTLVMNPPFNQVVVEKKFSFGSGKVSLAALFIDHFLKISNRSQRFVAILPDVIRSGSRYEKLRIKIEKLSKLTSIEITGRFSKQADIDVFILNAGKSNSNGITFESIRENKTDNRHKISDLATVRVGSVVPHRDKEEGESVDFYTSKEISSLPLAIPKRKVNSTTFTPPLVAVRRTSSPSDKNRIVARVIKGKRNIALENHLIAIIPNDSKAATCEKILSELSSAETVEFLNIQIRCRHLTVKSIKNIPINS